MNLVALPSTNEFLRLVKPRLKVQRQIDVSGELDERIQATPHELRPLVLEMLSGKTQEEAAKVFGISRHEVQKHLKTVQGRAQPVRPKTNDDKVTELYHQSCDTQEFLRLVNEAGLVKQCGAPFKLRCLYWWMDKHGLPPKNQPNASRVLIVKMKGEGYSYLEIAQELTRRGLTTKKGTTWTRRLVTQSYCQIVNPKPSRSKKQ